MSEIQIRQVTYMAVDSVGQIGLDLVVNQGDFKKQMSGIQSLAKKAGAALAGAFAVKKLVDFSAQCIRLGSDLAEVQNVVDVTFPRMSRRVEEFTKSAAQSFGLSETMAKRFTGTFGAMAKAFGFGEKAAYDMSTTLTGLAGDVASFYNISQDEAYTKLKSVFTGETESLKDLGVVMTQAALDQYALANGFKKTTQAMSEAEKVALRYQFVQDQLSLASGDFIRTSDSWANQVRVLKLQFDSLKATIGQGLINVLTPVIKQLSLASGDFIRTSDSWANQVRVLKLQFDSLKATIGQGLINVLTPVIKVINTIIGKMMSLANAFKAFTEMLAGKKGSGSASAVEGMKAVSDGAANVGTSVSKIGGAAKQATKDLKSVTTGIDELNIIDPDVDTGEAGGGGEYNAESFDMGELDVSPVEELDNRYQALIARIKELQSLFKEGFQIGFQNQEGLEVIRDSLKEIKESLIDIFADPAVQGAADSFLNSVALNMGKAAGAVSSVGVTIGANLLGGIDSYLSSNVGYIKERLVNSFDAKEDILNAWGDFAADFADVFKVLEGEAGQQITANIIEIFSNAVLGAEEIISRDFANISLLIQEVFSANKDKIKKSFEETLRPIEKVTGSLADLITNTFSRISRTYDEYVAPALERFSAGWTAVLSGALDAYNTYLAPVVDWIAERFSELVSEHIQPLLDAFVHLWGAATEAVSVFWEFISPFVSWLFETFFAGLSTWLSDLWTQFEGIFGFVSTLLTGFTEAAATFIEFIVNIFTGEWSEAWLNIQTIVSTVWNTIQTLITLLTGFTEAAATFIEFIVNIFTGEWSEAWLNIQTIVSTVWNTIQTLINTVLNIIRNIIRNILNAIKNNVSVVLNGIRTLFEQIWNLIRNLTASIWSAISGKLSETWTAIKNTASEKFTQLKEGIVDTWNTLKERTKSIWDGIWGTIKGVINSIISGVENMANRVVDGINAIINGINSLVGPLAEFVGLPSIPTLSGISLPRLAQGGFVRANTPQLAVIGDNRRQGEIVAPEDKMQAMADRAAELAAQTGGYGMSEQYLAAMVELLTRIIELIEQMDLTVNIDIREIKKRLTELDKRSGYQLRTT